MQLRAVGADVADREGLDYRLCDTDAGADEVRVPGANACEAPLIEGGAGRIRLACGRDRKQHDGHGGAEYQYPRNALAHAAGEGGPTHSTGFLHEYSSMYPYVRAAIVRCVGYWSSAVTLAPGRRVAAPNEVPRRRRSMTYRVAAVYGVPHYR